MYVTLNGTINFTCPKEHVDYVYGILKLIKANITPNYVGSGSKIKSIVFDELANVQR